MKNIHILHPEIFLGTPEELQAIQKLNTEFPNITHSTTIQPISKNTQQTIIIPRFRAIPFGKELETEVQLNNGQLINSYQQHRNIANIRNWVSLLRQDSNNTLVDNLTAAVYAVDDIPNLPEGEYFVKGETNSKKSDYFNSAYADSLKQLSVVVRNLQQDHYIGGQEVVIRPFQRFRQLGEAVDGRPVFNERRVFVLDGEIMSEAYYWSSFPEWQYVSDNTVSDGSMLGEEYYRALGDAIQATKHLARFYVIDMAELDPVERTERLKHNPDAYAWQVVELNDGCMSGVSENEPYELWRKVCMNLMN